jgi:hypothetical protein
LITASTGRAQIFAAQYRIESHVIDDQAQTRVALGNIAEFGHIGRRQRHHRNVVFFGSIPKPIGGAIVQPLSRLAAIENHADAEHVRLLLPGWPSTPDHRDWSKPIGP